PEDRVPVTMKLPCEVKLPGGMTVGRGCQLSTLLLAMRDREHGPLWRQRFGQPQPFDPALLNLIADNAAPIAQTAPLESEHHVQLLGQALGECIAAAGIIRPDASLSGPQLLMFADDLKRHLAEQTAPQPEQSGLVDMVRLALHNGQLVPDPEMDGSTEVFGIKIDDMEALEAVLSAQGESHE